jgi:hypothetical protein
VNLSEAVPSWVNPSAVLTFPIKWTRTYLVETNDAKKDNGAIGLDDFRVHFISTAVETGAVLPEEFRLYQNYPNPFNPSTKIKYSLPNVTLSASSRAKSRNEGSRVVLKVFDILGNIVATLVDEYKPAGSYDVDFNASSLSSGVYFYTLRSGSFVQTKKMILLR